MTPPPVHAERAVVAAAIHSGQPVVPAEAIATPALSVILDATHTAQGTDLPAGPKAVIEVLRRQRRLDPAGGVKAILDLEDDLPLSDAETAWCRRIVLEAHARRLLAKTAHEIAVEADERLDEDTRELIDRALAAVAHISSLWAEWSQE